MYLPQAKKLWYTVNKSLITFVLSLTFLPTLYIILPLSAFVLKLLLLSCYKNFRRQETAAEGGCSFWEGIPRRF